MRADRPREEQILVWCGVVAQLQRTRANRILGEAELPYPLFVLLRHFCHDPEREWTISQLTAAFETGQPGMTKKVQKLVERRLLASRSDERDGRKRWLCVTPAGIRLRDELTRRLEPDRAQLFQGWKPAEVDQLHGLLDRLRRFLDENRDSVALPPAPARGRRPRAKR